MAKTKQPNFELLKDAYAIIDGIPENRFDLDLWIDSNTRQNYCKVGSKALGACNTIACAGGWLAQHPMFNQLGLKISRPRYYQHKNYSGYTERVGDPTIYYRPKRAYHFEALAGVFNLDTDDAFELFCAVDNSRYDREILTIKGVSSFKDIHSKTIFLMRVKLFLKEQGQYNGKIS